MALKDKVDFLFIPQFGSNDKRNVGCPKFIGLAEVLHSMFPSLPEIIKPFFHKAFKKHGLFRLIQIAFSIGLKFTKNPFRMIKALAKAIRAYKLHYKELIINKKATGNPPITEEETDAHDGVTILVTEIGPMGDIQMYGTSNVESNIIPSNRFMYDPTPGIEAWTNDKFVANSGINTRIKYVILVKFKGDTRELTYTLNVR